MSGWVSARTAVGGIGGGVVAVLAKQAGYEFFWGGLLWVVLISALMVGYAACSIEAERAKWR